MSNLGAESHFVPLDFPETDPREQEKRAEEFFRLLSRRRTVREYSDRPVAIELIEKAIATAGTSAFRGKHAAVAIRGRPRS